MADVSVVGAGPAGAVAAVLLARAGLSVSLIDRVGDLDCKIGETLPAAGARILQQLDLPVLATEAPHRRIRSVISAWGAQPVQRDFLGQPGGGGLRLLRTAFDEALREQAYAHGCRRVDARVRAVARCAGGYELTTCAGQILRSRFLIDATGRSSYLARRLGGHYETGPKQVSLWALGSVPASESVPPLDSTLIESRSDGYWYGAWLPDGRALAAFHTTPRLAANLQRNPEAWRRRLHESLVLAPALQSERLSWSALRASDARGARLVSACGDGWFSCGDAAVSFEPLASQGIFNGLATARTAVSSLLETESRPSAGHRIRADYREQLQNVWHHYVRRRAALTAQAARYHRTTFWTEALC